MQFTLSPVSRQHIFVQYILKPYTVYVYVISRCLVYDSWITVQIQDASAALHHFT